MVDLQAGKSLRNLRLVWLTEGEQHFLLLVLYNLLDNAGECTIGKRDLALTIDDILLQVESDSLCRADILHRLRNGDASILADAEEAVDSCS